MKIRIKIALFLTCFLTWIIPLLADNGLGVNKVLQRKSWNAIEKEARGGDVYFNAWGGSQKINSYLNWVKNQVRREYGINLVHVKLADTVEGVTRISAEVQAEKKKQVNKKNLALREGSIDLLWVNGENFSRLKRAELLFGPFTEKLPNMQLVDNQSILIEKDFSEPIQGFEAPWGRAILTFFYNSKKIAEPEKSLQGLLAVAKGNPGRFAYPPPPNFHGTTFLKQVAYETFVDTNVLLEPVKPERFLEQSAPLWNYLNTLHQYLWREGEIFPVSLAKMHDMIDVGELYLGFSFNPLEAAQRKLEGTFPEHIETYVHDVGTIGNAHFLAIPINSPNKMAAMVVVNFLLSPKAQGHKNSVKVWGDPHVLNFKKMRKKDRSVFLNFSGRLPEVDGKQLQEPHASWVKALEEQWMRLYKK